MKSWMRTKASFRQSCGSFPVLLPCSCLMGESVHACVCTCLWRPEDNLPQAPLTLGFLGQDLSLVWDLIQLGWLTRGLQGLTCRPVPYSGTTSTHHRGRLTVCVLGRQAPSQASYFLSTELCLQLLHRNSERPVRFVSC